ncbi:hypothetical protein CANARDRAFT_230044 [[Candida] arabinofermentans NRRL YB-2248]|uniref:Uncharacterized protein n=1 Tax=[Candida] arabinofermentans NRRL YB-2248 TaxID=983967 RepID=A0A1E4T6W7_9ASCO|nr:hypothetical protein CANARDRAFT_230044 [[Candida] arabinofermentans NRRL YB-2248]
MMGYHFPRIHLLLQMCCHVPITSETDDIFTSFVVLFLAPFMTRFYYSPRLFSYNY